MASRNIAAHGSATVIEKRTEILNPALIFENKEAEKLRNLLQFDNNDNNKWNITI